MGKGDNNNIILVYIHNLIFNNIISWLPLLVIVEDGLHISATDTVQKVRGYNNNIIIILLLIKHA